MRKTKKQNRWLALALCLCMLSSVFPLSGITHAAGTGCNHTHDENCGYVEAVEGAPCTFTHEHDDACGYVEAVEGKPCTHVHDENCGGLGQDSGPAACTLNEGCKLPAGHEGDCDAPMALGASPSGSSLIQGKGYTFNPEDGKLTISTDKGCENWKNDERIPEPANKAVKLLEIQEGVTSISSYAFNQCLKIKKVVFPESLTEIRRNAFSYCTDLEEVVFSEGLRSIGDEVFNSCGYLRSVTFPQSLQSIGSEAFTSCIRLATLTFLGNSPPSSIASDAFYKAAQNGTIYYPEGADGNYTETWKSDIGRDNWTLSSLNTVFVPINDITLSCAATVSINTDLVLTATIDPVEASYQSIVWSVQDANGTGAEITGGNVLRATTGGVVTVLATVKNGGEITDGMPCNFTKEFTIFVKDPDATSLTVILDDDGGGTSLEDNPMKSAVEAALAHSGTNESKITVIKLRGRAGSITGWSWKYLLNLFESSGWAAQTLDLSGMDSLTKVENEMDGYREISRLTAVCFPESIQTIGKRAFYNCGSLNDLTFLGDTPPAVEADAFQGISPTGKVNFPGGAGAVYSDSWRHSVGLSGWALIDAMEAKEQYNIVKGRTYYFDLSEVAFPGEVHDSDTGHGDALPDISLRYMPFTYTGTVSAYVLPESMDNIQSTAENTARYVYDHSLFIADYTLVIKESGDEWPVSWNMLKDAGLIFGTSYADRGVDYTIRAPTTGGDSIHEYTDEERGIPENNEWDAILNKCGQYYKDNVSGYIKNWAYRSAWGQDTGDSGSMYDSIRWARGYSTARYSGLSSPDNQVDTYNYRPVLEILNTQGAADLKTMALNLNGGKLLTDAGYQGKPIEVLNFVYAGESFTAPDGSDYVRPADEAGTYLRWMDGDGKLYDPGESVPSSVTELKAIWNPPVSISKIDGVTVPVRGEAPVTEILETEQYTGTVAWSPDPGAAFAGDTEYTAVITLTPKTGYSLRDIVANFFTVEGAVATNDAGSGVVSAKFIPAYSLTVQAGGGGTVSGTASGSYKPGTSISVTATASSGYSFSGWTASGVTVGNTQTVSFNMPESPVTLTANFRYTGGSSDPGPTYTWRTLTDKATGVRVSGLFTEGAALEVKEMLLHPTGAYSVCDDIRARQDKGDLIVLFDIGLKSGKYKGDLEVEIPVDAKYNDQTAIILHCKDNVLESRTVTVSGGIAKGTFSSLSLYAVAKVTAKTVIIGLPESYTLLQGQSISWTPAPAGGSWSYDTDLLEMKKNGDTYTFKALKVGKATATYTVDGVPHTVTITINSSTIPQTGDTSSPWPWALLATAALLGCAALVGRKGGYKKRHG
ncbi:leucine-rich repeat protein [Lacrimispora sp. NSJ-141]|uniref:Leucine-rich repeat protein n=1 Tax=Lientehia hominis TaxID=2897778 RepID=A0AAP2RJR3_9FIRM|nr:leucine-rich repeat protein [Lientehia hominis]MCD2492708.1 leucine-rich repeat protein [Lientehia hominis]